MLLKSILINLNHDLEEFFKELTDLDKEITFDENTPEFIRQLHTPEVKERRKDELKAKIRKIREKEENIKKRWKI